MVGSSLGEELALSLKSAWLGVGRNTGNAVSLDAEIVTAHLHVEEAVDTPVGSPRVTADPVLLASRGVSGVADHRDLVVNHWESNFLGVDAAGVFFEGVRDVDTAGDGSICGELGLHLRFALDTVVVANVVLGVLYSFAAFDATLIFLGRWPGAVTAYVDVFGMALKVIRDVLHARAMRKTSLVSSSVNATGVSSIAGATFLKVDNSLRIDTNWCNGLEIIQDIEPIGDGRGRSLSPA